MFKPSSIESSLIKPDGLPEVTEYLRHHRISAFLTAELDNRGQPVETIKFTEFRDPEEILAEIFVEAAGAKILPKMNKRVTVESFLSSVINPVIEVLADIQEKSESIAGHEKFQGFFDSE
jgi:hypothetical protein